MKRILAILLALSIILLAGCGAKKSGMANDDFKAQMLEKGYEIVDATDKVNPNTIGAVSIAIKDGYQIEYYVAHSVDKAQTVYDLNVSSFKEVDGEENNSQKGNYSSYEKTSADTFYTISKVDNTFIYSVAPVEYKDEIKQVIKDLGY
ncbi:MAG: hypothetical protein GX127_03610 [Eubacteriaceae bacterium]|jgi:hypothetical protein|nr:hypothetical protein [Eubacteriaceae bacterium]